jgi:hypothetical protein
MKQYKVLIKEDSLKVYTYYIDADDFEKAEAEALDKHNWAEPEFDDCEMVKASFWMDSSEEIKS